MVDCIVRTLNKKTDSLEYACVDLDITEKTTKITMYRGDHKHNPTFDLRGRAEFFAELEVYKPGRIDDEKRLKVSSLELHCVEEDHIPQAIITRAGWLYMSNSVVLCQPNENIKEILQEAKKYFKDPTQFKK